MSPMISQPVTVVPFARDWFVCEIHQRQALSHSRRLPLSLPGTHRPQNGQQAARDILNSQEDKAANDTAGLNKRQRELAEGLQGILAQYGKVLGTRMSSTASREELTAAYISAARAHYTQQEVQAQIGFYDTSVGQSILAKNPKVSADFLQAALPSEEEMQQTRGELEQMLPQIKQIFKDVF